MGTPGCSRVTISLQCCQVVVDPACCLFTACSMQLVACSLQLIVTPAFAHVWRAGEGGRAGLAGAGAGSSAVIDEVEAEEDAEYLTVACPAGVGPGDALYVTTPDGDEIEVVVPEGVGEGDEFEVCVKVDEAAVEELTVDQQVAGMNRKDVVVASAAPRIC